MVVMIHASKMCVQMYSEQLGIVPGTGVWLGLVGYRAIFVAPTVLFIMISGIFFLTPQRDVTARKVWTKNIPKLACAYVLWSLIYAIYRIFWQMNPTPDFSIKLLIKEWIVEPPHLWYIPMMIGLYILVPLLRCITTSENSRSMYKYGLAIFIGSITLQTFSVFKYTYYTYYRTLFQMTPAGDFCVYAFWMVYGYFLYTYRPSKKARILIYIAGLISVFVYIGVNVWELKNYGKVNGDILSHKFVLTTFFKNTAIFVFIINCFSKVNFEGIGKKILTKISNNTLMIYLCHYLILYIFYDNGLLFNQGVNPLVAVWIIGIVTYIAGLLWADIFHLVKWKKLRNKVLDAFFPNRKYLVTKK